MKTMVIYSSATGNTKKLAEEIIKELEDSELMDIKDVKHNMLDHYDMVYLGYWVDKGNLDAQIYTTAERLSSRTVWYAWRRYELCLL